MVYNLEDNENKWSVLGELFAPLLDHKSIVALGSTCRITRNGMKHAKLRHCKVPPKKRCSALPEDVLRFSYTLLLHGENVFFTFQTSECCSVPRVFMELVDAHLIFATSKQIETLVKNSPKLSTLRLGLKTFLTEQCAELLKKSNINVHIHTMLHHCVDANVLCLLQNNITELTVQSENDVKLLFDAAHHGLILRYCIVAKLFAFELTQSFFYYKSERSLRCICSYCKKSFAPHSVVSKGIFPQWMHQVTFEYIPKQESGLRLISSIGMVEYLQILTNPRASYMIDTIRFSANHADFYRWRSDDFIRDGLSLDDLWNVLTHTIHLHYQNVTVFGDGISSWMRTLSPFQNISITGVNNEYVIRNGNELEAEVTCALSRSAMETFVEKIKTMLSNGSVQKVFLKCGDYVNIFKSDFQDFANFVYFERKVTF